MADKTKKGGLKEIYVREEFKMAVKLALDKFRQEDEKKGNLLLLKLVS